ncbi:hypothetical protein POMI540_2942 [Schizosaccharomyces pombe]
MRKQAGGPCEKLNFPLVELEPYARVNRETTKLNKAHVRRDYSGRSICQPDTNNPTRWKYERPLETIRAWQDVAEGKVPASNEKAARVSNLKTVPSLKRENKEVNANSKPPVKQQEVIESTVISNSQSPSVKQLKLTESTLLAPSSSLKPSVSLKKDISSNLLCAAASNGYFRKPAAMRAQTLVPITQPDSKKNELKQKFKHLVHHVLT